MPAAERHLATHDGHLVRVTDRDLPAVVAAADLIPTLGLSGPPEQVCEKLAGHAAGGVTEVVYSRRALTSRASSSVPRCVHLLSVRDRGHAQVTTGSPSALQ